MPIYEIKINQGNHFKTHKKETYLRYEARAARAERIAITAKIIQK